MFSRADQRFLLLSLGWYNLTAAWHQGQLETGNSYVTALQIELKLYMSPDQVTRASSKSSSVSPGDSLGETAYWWKEIMYHRQKEGKKTKTHHTTQPSAVPLQPGPAAALSHREKEALSSEADGVSVAGGYWRNNSMHGMIHTEWEKCVFNIITNTSHRGEIVGLLMWRKKPLAVMCALEERRESLRQDHPLWAGDQLFWREYVHTGLKAWGWNIFWCFWWPRTFFPKVVLEKGKIVGRFSL